MAYAAPPTIPPRPSRAQAAAAAGAAKLPEIPPRPFHKRLERSTSPSRGPFPQSPLNEPPVGSTLGLARTRSNEPSNLSLPPRPPSVTLPSIGQEGNEYADLEYENKTTNQGEVQEPGPQTRNIHGDLPIHAPKPSLPKASAKAQVQAVTRTDSREASALGFGSSVTPTPEDHEPSNRSLKSKSSFSRPTSSASIDRHRGSATYEDEPGPAELGMRVPINPALGDVQAPSPTPPTLHHGPGGHGGSKRHHSRTKSGRTVLLPPDSYGLHGHGATVDKFDKDWYAKHPEAYQHEEGHGQYSSIGSGRGTWAMSSEDLNKIVRDTASRGAGFGTSPNVVSYPDEQIGYLASEQYSSRMASPGIQGDTYVGKSYSNHSQPVVESPLRRTSFPAEFGAQAELTKTKTTASSKSVVLHSDSDEDGIHVDEPSRRYNKITGGPIRETEDLGPEGGNHLEGGGYVDEHGYGVPILASDEVAKEPSGDFMQPAISPKQERRGSAFAESGFTSGEQTPGSRPVSRPSSVHGIIPGLSRFTSRNEDREDMHTPLEDVDEYEPLFPDDEDGKKKPLTAAERFKQRPEVLKHRFPSQDIWEDTPASALHEATVTTPDLPRQEAAHGSAATFEPPEKEAARKGEVSEAEKATLRPKEERLAKSKFAPHLRDDMPTRPGLQQRFPSSDIWEDSPESVHLVTTVQSRSSEESKSPPDGPASKPNIPPRPAGRSKLGVDAAEPSIPPSDAKQPTVPSRPPKRTHQVPPADAKLTDPRGLTKETSPVEKKQQLVSMPERPKPQVPARPAKKTSSEGAPEGEQLGSPLVPAKSKPTVPVRSAGANAKFASVKAGFLSNLEKQLQHGPQGPPVKEKEAEVDEEKDKAPLSDARKGRAKGPQRRKPASSSLAASAAEPSALPGTLSVTKTRSIWHLSGDGSLHVIEDSTGPDSTGPDQPAIQADSPAAAFAPPLAKNVAGEPADPLVLPSSDASPAAEKSDPLGEPATDNAPHPAKSPSIWKDRQTADGSPIEKVAPVQPPTTATSTQEPETSPSEEQRGEGVARPAAPTSPGAGAEGQPLPESISDRDLEEMTASADGKMHAPEEDSGR